MNIIQRLRALWNYDPVAMQAQMLRRVRFIQYSRPVKSGKYTIHKMVEKEQDELERIIHVWSPIHQRIIDIDLVKIVDSQEHRT